MTCKFILKTLLTLAFIGVGFQASAETDLHEDEIDEIKISSVLKLKDIIQHTLERDPRKILAEEYRSSRTAFKNQAERPYSASPVFDLHYQTDKIVDDTGLQEWESNLQIPIWRRHQRQALQELGSSYDNYADAYDSKLKLEVAGMVREIVWELVIAREKKHLAWQALDKAKALEKEVTVREKAGDLATVDILLAQDETLEKQLAYVTLRMEYLHAAERFTALTGLKQIPDNITEDIVSKSENSIEIHPALIAINAAVERAQAQLKQIRTSQGQNTQLIITARNERASAGENDITSIGIGINIPFDTEHFQQSSVAQTHNMLTELVVEKQQLIRALKLQINNEHHELETIRQQIEVLNQRQAAAQENLRLAHTAFKAGELDVGQLIRVSSQTNAVEMQFVLHLLEEKQAMARINQAMGVIP